MSSETTKHFQNYAQDCVKLAQQPNTPPELRQQLFQMAREWMQAMMAEEEDASTIPKKKPPPARTVSPHPAAPERREDA
jgi:hypothetical protein